MSAAGAASAQVSSADKAKAESLFMLGLEHHAKKDLEKACPKFVESFRLDPQPSTQFFVAECLAREGKLASAWASYLEVAGKVTIPEQVRAARDGADAVKARMPYLRITVPEAVGSTQGVAVRHDGADVGRGQWNDDVPVDFGEHVISVTAPGYEPWEAKVAIGAEQQRETVTIPALRRIPPPPPPPPPPPDPPKRDPGDSEARTEAGATQRTAGIVVGAVGLVGLGVGTFFGMKAIGKDGDSDSHCNDDNECDQAGVTLRDEAFDAATISTVAFVAGSLAVAGGVALYLTAPPGDEGPAAPRTGLFLGPGGVWARGTF